MDETGVMLLDVAGRGVSVRCRYVAPLTHGKDQLHPYQFVLVPASAKADRSNVASHISTTYRSKGLAPKSAHLRATWIHHFMHGGIADKLICGLSGRSGCGQSLGIFRVAACVGVD